MLLTTHPGIEDDDDTLLYKCELLHISFSLRSTYCSEPPKKVYLFKV